MRSWEPVDVIVEGLDLPDGGFWTDESMFDPEVGEPAFGIGEVAGVFFGRKTSWLKWHALDGHLNLDTLPVVIPRSISSDLRRWRLYDIERAAHALAQGGHISVGHLVRVVEIVKLVAQNYHYLLPDPVATRIEEHDPEIERKALMAVETMTTVRDDLDDSPDAVPRYFSLGTNAYRIDLTDENWATLLDVMHPYVAAAQPSRVRVPTPPEQADYRRRVREWALDNDLDVGQRGRIASHIIEAYERAHPS